MNDITAWALANTVSAYATVLSGLMALALTALVHLQPRRRIAVYVGVVVRTTPTRRTRKSICPTFIAGLRR